MQASASWTCTAWKRAIFCVSCFGAGDIEEDFWRSDCLMLSFSIDRLNNNSRGKHYTFALLLFKCTHGTKRSFPQGQYLYSLLFFQSNIVIPPYQDWNPKLAPQGQVPGYKALGVIPQRAVRLWLVTPTSWSPFRKSLPRGSGELKKSVR